MSINWDKCNKRWRFEFKREIAGKRHRASRLLPQGWSQAQADAFDRKESARLYAVAAGLESVDPPVEDAVVLYLQDKTGLKSYQKAAENLAAIAWAYMGRPMSDLPAISRDVMTATAGMRDGVILKPATIKQRLALLKAACRWAWKQHNLTPNDPTVRMQMPIVRNDRRVYATRAQVGSLAWAADRRDLRTVILLAFYTGMRLGEIKRAVALDGALWLDDTKNGEPRAIPVHPHVQRLLKFMPITTGHRTLQAAFHRARVRAGLPHIHIHDLRHSAASAMINGGVDLYTVGQVLGHKDPRSTQRYAHLQHATLADAVGRIGQKPPHKSKSSPKKNVA